MSYQDEAKEILNNSRRNFQSKYGDDFFNYIDQYNDSLGVIWNEMLGMNGLPQYSFDINDTSKRIAGHEAETPEPDYWYDKPEKQYSMRLQSPFVNISQSVQHGGNLSGAKGFNGEQQPYLIISTPSMDIDPNTYGHYFGYPSNITTQMNTLLGYTQVGTIHLNGIGCTSVEEGWLSAALHSGVIINNWADTRPGIFTLYKNNSDPNVIGKSLSTLRTFTSIKLKSATSIISPTFLLTGIDDIIKDINYLYYPEFGRYYFVNNVVSVRDDLWQVSCTTDVLESFKTRVAGLQAHIERQEFNYNLYLNDSRLRADSRAIIRTLKFPKNFDDEPFTYIIVGYGPPGGEVSE